MRGNKVTGFGTELKMQLWEIQHQDGDVLLLCKRERERERE